MTFGALLLLAVSGQAVLYKNPEGPVYVGRSGDASLLRILPTAGTPPGGECSGTAITGTRGETVTFARASSAYCTKADGTMVSLTNNQPRVSLVSSAPMLLVEDAVTNLVLRSDDMSQAVWTKTNATCTATATSPTGVANSASTCTATAGNGTVLQGLTVAAATRSTSLYVKRRTGTGNIDLTRDNGGTWATLTSTQCRDPGTLAATAPNASTWVRCELASSVLNPTVGIRLVTNGDAVDLFTAQDEPGAFATSGIATAGTTATRAVETATVPTPAGLSVSTFCYGARVRPVGASWSANAGMIQTNTADVASAARSFISPGGAGTFRFYNYDTAPAAKIFTSNAAVTAALHDLVAIWSAGTPSATQDGAAFAGTVSGAGTGIVGTHGGTTYIGGSSGVSLYGYIGSVRLANGTTGCDR
jgi:hypothetical protein